MAEKKRGRKKTEIKNEKINMNSIEYFRYNFSEKILMIKKENSTEIFTNIRDIVIDPDEISVVFGKKITI